MTYTENHDHGLLVTLYESMAKTIGKEIKSCRMQLSTLNRAAALSGKQHTIMLIEKQKKINKKLLFLEKRRKILLFWIRFMKALDEYATMGRKNAEAAIKLRQEQYMQQIMMEYLTSHKNESRKILGKMLSNAKEQISVLLETNNSNIALVHQIFSNESLCMEEILATLESDKRLLKKEQVIVTELNSIFMDNGILIDEDGNFDFEQFSQSPRERTLTQSREQLLNLLGQFLALHAELELICSEQDNRVHSLRYSEDPEQDYLTMRQHWDPKQHINGNASLLSSYEELLSTITTLEAINPHKHQQFHHHEGKQAKTSKSIHNPTHHRKNSFHMYTKKKAEIPIEGIPHKHHQSQRKKDDLHLYTGKKNQGKPPKPQPNEW